MKKLIFTMLLAAIFLPAAVKGKPGEKPKWWIYFTDKEVTVTGQYYVSPRTVANREAMQLPVHQYSDYPLNASYLDSLKHFGVYMVCHSRWLNAVTANLDESQVSRIRSLGFVKAVRPVQYSSYLANTGNDAVIDPDALLGVRAPVFNHQGLEGKEVLIGIIDGPFTNADSYESLAHLFSNNQVLGYRDFVTANNPNFFNGEKEGGVEHGSQVWQRIAGWDKSRKKKYGLATGASFYLARTEDPGHEFRGEEDYWIEALEWMDSLGVRLVNSSLGYANGFANAGENYRYEDMNGKNSAIARAAQVAFHEKGMTVVVAAGNIEDNWEIISTPADAEGIIAVGASDPSGLKLDLSATGPHFLPYLKPNVSCVSLEGTSYSAPVITGMIACIMQKNPALTNHQIKRLIEQSANLYPFGNNYIGFGIPDARKIVKLLEGRKDKADSREVKCSGDTYTFRLKQKPSGLLVFHKKDQWHVLRQAMLSPDDRTVTITKAPGVQRSTVSWAGKVLEIVWE